MEHQTKLVIKKETRERCEIKQVDAETIDRDYLPLNMDLFNLFYQVPSIDFTIYFRVGNEMIAFITPEEFSHQLLDDIRKGTSKESSESVEPFILRADEKKYCRTFDELRRKKIDQLTNMNKSLDPKLLNAVCDIAALNNKIVRGGITPKVAEEVTYTVHAVFDQLMANNRTLLASLIKMIKIDPTLYEHSATVALVGGAIAKSQLRLDDAETVKVILAGLYHDIGKTCVPPSIAAKVGKFNEEEFNAMKSHTYRGFEELNKAISKGAAIELDIAKVSLEHHERFEGHGYPLGLRGRKEEDSERGIHLYSRIIAVADVFAALLSERVYKPTYHFEEALKILSVNAHMDFDINIIGPFLKTLSKGVASELEKDGLGLPRSKTFVNIKQDTLVYDDGTANKKKAS
jgi:putative nucleotidyltransferase with HDIG domain